MKHVFRIVVLALASIVTLQPILAEGPCAPGSCAGDRCGTACCSTMNTVPAQPTGANCHSWHATEPMRSTQGPHSCDMTAARAEMQSAVPAKLRAAGGMQLALSERAPRTVLRVASAQQRLGLHGPQRARYLFLQVFRI